MHQPPSDSRSAFLSAISIVVGVLGDIVGVMFNPAKTKRGAAAMGQLKAYLDASGVGDELENAVWEPMLRGRLLHNLKILSDIQQQQDADRHIESKLEGTGVTNIEREVREGHRFMRFATAAYGMIKSAVDFVVDPEELKSHKDAIAVHTCIDPEDVRYMYSKDDCDKNILHHFAAVDRKTKSIILALRGTLSISCAITDGQGMARDFCLGLAHHGMADMAEKVWEVSGKVINSLFLEDELKDYGFIITGHSLGAGVACLLNIMCHVNKLVGKRKVMCYGFAPPPTYSPCNLDDTGDGKPDPPDLVKQAIQNCTAYIHDNDAVPFLLISSIRRLALILDAVDNKTENMWFYDRWKVCHEWKDIPREIHKAVAEAANIELKFVDGECNMIIPARSVIWAKKKVLNDKFEGFCCDSSLVLVAKNTVFMSPEV
ncbi:hypothetical protein ACHAXR_003533 [Thalassiosira sp. AJA248-18]